MTNLHLPFNLGEAVIIDGGRSMKGTVTAYTYRGSGLQTEVCWFSDGAYQSAWIDTWRLEQYSEGG